MRNRNPFSNRRLQSTRERRRAAEPSVRQKRRVVLALRDDAAREIKKGLLQRIMSRKDKSSVD